MISRRVTHGYVLPSTHEFVQSKPIASVLYMQSRHVSIAIESAVAVLRHPQRSLAALGAQRMIVPLSYLLLISLHGAAYARAGEEFSAIYAVQSTFVSWSPMIAATNGICIGTTDLFVRS